MQVTKLLFIIIFGMGLGLAFPAYAQQYIDIDLSPPKPKPQPSSGTSKKPPAKAAKPRPAAPKQAVSKPTPKAAAPKQAPPKPAPKINPVAKPTPPPQPAAPLPAVKPSKAHPKAPPKPVVTKPVLPTPPPLPVPVPTPPEPVVAVPPPTPPPQKELSLDDPSLKDPQPVPKPVSNAEQKSQAFNTSEDDSLKFKNRHGFTVDYSTFYETLKIKSKVTNGLMEGSSHYFGVSFNYDFTVYREKYGFAVTLGGITGNAQAGTKDSGDYYERRIAWTGFRGGGRLFYRANNRIDLGLGFLALSKSTKWPEEDSFSVLAQANPHYFYYLDTRWRLNYKYEIVQSFGAHLRSYALSWLLGITYTLN